MPKRLIPDLARWRKDPRILVRLGLGALLAANLVAAAIVFKPWASSVEELEREASGLRQQVRQREMALERLRAVVDKVEAARTDGDRFEQNYLLSKRSMASVLTQELVGTAQKAGMRQKETTYSFEPVEGSDTLTKATITGIYEGTYADLMHFLNLLDRSNRFLIIESLGAAPQQSGLTLGVTLKLSGFVREGGDPPPALAENESEPPARAEVQQPQPPAPQARPQTVVQAVPAAAPASPAVAATGPARGFAPVPIPRRVRGNREIQ
jgi:type IV pilus assembly protein PilO